MLAVVLALAASASIGTGDFLAGSQARRTSLWTVIIFSQLAGFAWTAVVVLARGRGLPAEVVLPAVGAGLTAVAGIAMGYGALAIGVMSIIGPIISISAAVPLIVGLARGERPSYWQLAGMAIALLGVVLAAREKSAGRHHEATSKLSVVLALLTAAVVGINLLFYAQGAQHDAYWTVFLARTTSLAVFLAGLMIMRPGVRLTRAAALPILAIGLLDTGSNALFSVASTLGYLSVVSVLSSVSPVFTVVLAYLFVHERLSRVQQLGVATALLGVAMIAAG
jgi:drug/metabolite transporter (DMT)-like permease